MVDVVIPDDSNPATEEAIALLVSHGAVPHFSAGTGIPGGSKGRRRGVISLLVHMYI